MSNCLLLCLSLTLVYLFDIIIFESNGDLRIQIFFVTLNIVTACVYCMYYTVFCIIC